MVSALAVQLPLFEPRRVCREPRRALCSSCLRSVLLAVVGRRLVVVEFREWEPLAACPSCLYTRHSHPGRPVSCSRCRDSGLVGSVRPRGWLLAIDTELDVGVGLRLIGPEEDRRQGEALFTLHACAGDARSTVRKPAHMWSSRMTIEITRVQPLPLALRRIELGLEQTDVSRLTGLAPETISRLENGHRRPRTETKRLLAAALASRPEDLFP